jgi:hypothetical protein
MYPPKKDDVTFPKESNLLSSLSQIHHRQRLNFVQKQIRQRFTFVQREVGKEWSASLHCTFCRVALTNRFPIFKANQRIELVTGWIPGGGQ